MGPCLPPGPHRPMCSMPPRLRECLVGFRPLPPAHYRRDACPERSISVEDPSAHGATYQLPPSPRASPLAAALETLFDFGVLLVQPLPSLLRQRILEAIAGVVPRQHVDARVQRGEAGLPGHLRE